MGSQRVVRRHHYFYGFEHQYGASVAAPGGGDLGTCYVFWSRADRDAWVRKARTDDHNAPGYREAYPASKARGWDIYTELGYAGGAAAMKRIETDSDRLAYGEPPPNFRVALSWVLRMCEHEQNQVRRTWDGDTSPVIAACEEDARRALNIYEACMRAAEERAVEQMRAYADTQYRAYLDEIADALATGNYRHLAF